MTFKEPSFFGTPDSHVKVKSRAGERSTQFRLHVISHTHWDREWHTPFQQHRHHLAKLIDRLIDLLERNHDFRYFVLDGQTILLEDYLEIRPENRERLKRLIEGGRLEIGPWYVQPDEFLVSGESLVRNLMLGRRAGEEFGSAMKVGYLPDSFGHLAQLPQILRGFDIDSFIFTRGLGDQQERLGAEFLWIAPDGSRVLAINQRKGYDNGNHLGFEKAGDHHRGIPRLDLAVDQMRQQISQLGDHAHSGGDGLRHILIGNGSDHEEPQATLPKILHYLNTVLGDATVEQTTLTRFVHNLRRAGLSLPDFTGELRGSRQHFILSGILSARVPLKQKNQACETLLEKYAEPLATLAANLTDAPGLAGFLQHAWKLLVQNHTHDAIGGSHVDSVSNDMLPRFEQVGHLGNVVVAAAIQAVASRVRPHGAPSFIVFNPLPVARREVIKTMVLAPPDFPLRHLHVVDARGQALPTYVRQVQKIRSRLEYPLPTSFLRICQPSSNFKERLAQLASDIEAYGLTPSRKDKPWRVIELEALLENVPASGYRAFSLKSVEAPSRLAGVKIKGKTIENAFLRVRVYSDGTFDLHHKPTKRDFKRCNLLEDVEDAGDTYDHSPAARRSLFTSKNRRGRLRFIQKSPLAATVECSFIMALPEGFDRRTGKRRRRLMACSTRVLLTLNAADPWVNVVVEFDNQARDHRLSASFAAPLSATASFAGQSFYVVERPLKISAGKNWKQPPADTAPLQDFCMVEDRRGGLALLARGLYEYRAQREGRNTALKLTLLRAVGWLSRDDLSTRPGHAGPFLPTPDAQCTGAQKFEYAIMPYASNWRAANVQGHALRFQAPVLDAPLMNGGGNLPDEFSLVSIEPSTLRFSVLKKCAYRDTVILRVTNLHNQRGKAKIRCGKPLRHAWKVTLAENRIEEIPVLHDDTLEVDVPGWRVLTLELEPGRTAHGV